MREHEPVGIADARRDDPQVAPVGLEREDRSAAGIGLDAGVAGRTRAEVEAAVWAGDDRILLMEPVGEAADDEPAISVRSERLDLPALRDVERPAAPEQPEGNLSAAARTGVGRTSRTQPRRPGPCPARRRVCRRGRTRSPSGGAAPSRRRTCGSHGERGSPPRGTRGRSLTRARAGGRSRRRSPPRRPRPPRATLPPQLRRPPFRGA